MSKTLTLNTNFNYRQEDVEGGESQLWAVTKKSTVNKGKIVMQIYALPGVFSSLSSLCFPHQLNLPKAPISIGKASARVQNFTLIKECILERNPINVNSVVKVSVSVHIFSFIRESIQEKNPINVMTVERALVTAQIFIFTRGFTQERSLINVLSVVRVSATAQLFEFIRESTQERKLINAMSITRDSIRIHIFTITAEEKPCNSVHFVVTALIKASL